MKITILSLFRDSEKTIKNCLQQLEELEKNTNADFEYFFYENDSIDKTKEILQKWMKNKKGKLISENINAPKFGSIVSEKRMQLMTKYRNNLLKAARPFKSKYTLILDSDVLFSKNIIDLYLKYMSSDIAMITPNILQNIKCKMFDKNKDSYYDCLALLDKENRQGMIWVSNPFWSQEDRSLWNKGEAVEVSSAFGGFPIIKSEILNEVDWSTEGNCEHWNFCRNVRKFGKILVVPSIVTRVIIPESTLNHLKNIYGDVISKQWIRFTSG